MKKFKQDYRQKYNLINDDGAKVPYKVLNNEGVSTGGSIQTAGSTQTPEGRV